MKLSVIIPVHNEEGNVARLHSEVLSAVEKMKLSFEIIFVDDGSTDSTYQKLLGLSPAKIIRFRRNYGQTAALDAGLKAAAGEFLVTMDGDLQNDPNDISRLLLELVSKDLDVICGWRKNRKDKWSKKFLSRGARWLRSRLIHDGVRDAGCTLRVYRRECLIDFNLRGEMHRFIPAILKWRGFKVGELVVNHRPRYSGVSNYTFSRVLKGFLDILTLWFFQKYASRPLHFLGAAGILSSIFGSTMLGVLAIARLLLNYSLSSKIWPLIGVFFILFGFQLFASGLIMDLIIQSSQKTLYSIKDVTTTKRKRA